MVNKFANVIHDVNWSENGGNGIPKGRAWATAGENYTINEILEPNMNGTDKPCGLTSYTNLTIGYLSDYPERSYSSKIVIENYNLTVHNEGDTIYFPYSELFPMGVGYVPKRNMSNPMEYLNRNFSFSNTRIEVKNISKWDYILDHLNVSCDSLNIYDYVVGPVVYLDTIDSVPESQDCIFILKEELASEEKLDNLSEAMGCILIENQTKTYTFENGSQYHFPITKINGTNSNFSTVFEEIQSGSDYFVDNVLDNTTLVFSNFSNVSCFPNLDWVAFFNLRSEGDFKDAEFLWNMIKWIHYPPCCECLGAIMSNFFDDTHFMSHTVRDWQWFTAEEAPLNSKKLSIYSNRFALPIFSINGSFTDYFIDNEDTIIVDGFLKQSYKKQTNNDPGVISHNVIAYRNITHSPDDAIVVLSNRMDGWWGETPGDSGTSGAILLGIAKYFNDNNITPKYNLTFLFTTGEEYGMRGAQHFVDSHPTVANQGDYNFIYWIGFEQCGFHYPPDATHNLSLSSYNSTIPPILNAIQDQTNYEERTDYQYNPNGTKDGFSGAEDYVWKDSCNTILIEKSENWDGHHQTGNNFSEGDSLKYIDRNDVNVTFELAWNMTKYFTVNPDCWFSDIAYEIADSPYDDDTIDDSINATFTIHSILPNDKVQVIASLWPEYYSEPITYANVSMNYTVTPANITDTITVTLPPGSEEGNYWLRLSLYNSTGRINLITKISNLEDDYNNSPCFNLSPRDNDPPATPNKPTESDTLLLALNRYNYTTNTTDPNQDQIQYEWDWLADTTHQYETTGFYPSGVNCTLSHAYSFGQRKCIKVRAIDQYGAASEWSEPLDLFLQQFTSFDMSSKDYVAVVDQPSDYYGYIYGNVQDPVNWTWEFNGCSRDAENYTSYTQNTEETFTVLSDYNVTLTVTDNDTSAVNITKTITTKNLHSEFTTNYTGSIPPGESIAFINQSLGRYTITNQTWDFDDGTISYEENPTHIYSTSGVYNVSLTIRDSESNSDTSFQLISIHTDETPPEIQLVSHELAIDQNWFVVGLVAFVNDHDSGVDQVSINITYPDQSFENHTMIHLFDNVYFYLFNDTDIVGEYNYSIWVVDYENNTNGSTEYNFTIPEPPVLLYATTTPADNTSSNDNWVDVNVTVLDQMNTSAFIDWNRNLKGYWPMESYNDTGVYDNSSYENFGTFQNGMSSGDIVSGRYGNAVWFDGSDDYLDVGTSDSLDLGTGDFTFMVWEKSYTTLYSNKAMILTNNPRAESWKGYGFGVMNGSYLFVSQSSGNNVTLQGTVDVTDNTWHHIAYVCRSGHYYIYVDGEEDADTWQLVTKNITNAQSTMIAYDGHAPEWCYFDGTLDEPQLYARALSWEEINASYNNEVSRLYHNFTGLSDGVYSFSAHAIDTAGNQSSTETRQILIDTLSPVITNVNASPHTVGFGYEMTITADVVDDSSGIDFVTVEITPPGGVGNSSNYTMTLVSNDTYQYVFNDTWRAGQYNYTIWAADNASNSNSSDGHHFHVSAEATISIATLKNTYSGTQYINITDPPNPPEEYLVVDRGLTWNIYYNASSGENILETYLGPVNYPMEDGTWMPINNTLSSLPEEHPAYVYGYRTGNNEGLYGVYFKSNAQLDWPVAFSYNRSGDPTVHAIRSELVGVGYVDPQNDWAYKYLQNVQSSQGQATDYSITYPGVFTGTDVTWSYGNTGLKEEITLSNTTKTVLQNHPPSQYGLNDASSYLVFITKLDYQNLALYNSSGLLDGNTTINDTGIEFRDLLGQFKCALPLGEAYELNNETARQKLTYRIIHLNGNTYLLSGLKVADLNEMAFPVVIDPTLTVYSISSDGYIYNSGTNYNTVRTATSGTVNSAGAYITIGQRKLFFPDTYYIYRGFVFFNTSVLPSNSYLDDATLSLYKKDDYSTTDFDITIQNGQSTYPHNPMQTGDYNKNYYYGNGGALNTASFTSGYNAIKMNNLTWINKTGITKLCLRSSRDISGTAPSGNEYVTVHSNEFLGMCPPKLVINYRNQSKIKNTGDTDIKGYLLIQVQFYNSTQGKWLVDNDTINETSSRTITSGNQLAFDTIFNGLVRASDLTHGAGTYRVYAAFRDPEGNILRTNDDVDLEAWWEFSKT